MASINVQAQRHAVTLKYRSRSYGGDWTDGEQRIPIAWTTCRFGGERPWFISSVAENGVYCGRSVIKLYSGGRLFACRHCYQLGYASQQQPAHLRGLRKSQKVRMRLGGSGNMLEEFPDKPKGMHWPTYERRRRVHDLAEKQSLMSFGDRLGRLRTHIAPLAIFATVNWVHIPFEEAKMRRQFGVTYDDYVARVRRWL